MILYTAYAFFALLVTLFLSGIACIFLPELANSLTQFYLAFASASALCCDDGQGLQLEKIRVKAQSLGLDRTLDNSCAESLANLIFLPSFSTKSEADEISGRGVGMDAVRAYMEKLEGRVTLQVEAEKERAGYFAFSIIMDVPRTHFTPLASERIQLAFHPVRAAS